MTGIRKEMWRNGIHRILLFYESENDDPRSKKWSKWSKIYENRLRTDIKNVMFHPAWLFVINAENLVMSKKLIKKYENSSCLYTNFNAFNLRVLTLANSGITVAEHIKGLLHLLLFRIMNFGIFFAMLRITYGL